MANHDLAGFAFLAKQETSREMHGLLLEHAISYLDIARERGNPSEAELALLYAWACSIVSTLFVHFRIIDQEGLNDYSWAEANFLSFGIMDLAGSGKRPIEELNSEFDRIGKSFYSKMETLDLYVWGAIEQAEEGTLSSMKVISLLMKEDYHELLAAGDISLHESTMTICLMGIFTDVFSAGIKAAKRHGALGIA